jgi:hypothetical protein
MRIFKDLRWMCMIAHMKWQHGIINLVDKDEEKDQYNN